uniref:Uncharacterized protein n=1 Tax=Arundo donax TaxID=35708 RepID=A0A0A9P5U2_ARUDO
MVIMLSFMISMMMYFIMVCLMLSFSNIRKHVCRRISIRICALGIISIAELVLSHRY